MRNYLFLHQFRCLLLGSLFFFPASFAWAQITIIKGELITARQVTIDGERPVSGLTLYNENKIKTSTLGVAIINLGTNGRIELGAETDYTLLLAPHLVGGELRVGRIIINVPANVSVAIKGAGCQVETDGMQSSTLSIESSKERFVVVAYQGTARITYTGKTEMVASGEEVRSSLLSWEWRHREMPNPTIGRTTVQLAAARSATMLNLFGISIAESLRHLIASFSLLPSYYDSTLTCRNHDSLRCYANGGVKP